MEDNIKIIIERAKKGDEEAFNQLFQQYYGKAYAIAWRITKNDADAKDVVQETFLSIHASLKDLRETENFVAWMRMIVISKCNKLFRKKHDFPLDPAVFTNTQKKEYRSYMTPQDHIDYVSEQEVLQMLVAKLKPKYQIIIEYVYFKQLRLEETAQLLDLSLGTVKTRLHRARKDLLREIKRFEKENHRKVEFHSDILTIATVSIFYYSRLGMRCVKQMVKDITASSLGIASSLALGVVLMTGGAFRLYDASIAKAPASLQPTDSLEQSEDSVHLPSNAFPATSYFDKTIYNNKDAYYICINFAMDEADMKKKTHEELLTIQPLYASLKQENSAYWQRLVNEGWVFFYEQALSL